MTPRRPREGGDPYPPARQHGVPRVHLGKPPARHLVHRSYELPFRIQQHRLGHGSEFVRKYGVNRLVYVEGYETAVEAIRREKQLKKWNRDWKIQLIEQDNLEWRDLSDLIV
jgi:putative endonuclease